MKLWLPQYAYVFLGGFYFAMAALHLILYTFNRHRKMNLFYGLGLAVASTNYAFVDISIDPDYSAIDEKANILLNTISNGTLLYFAVYYIIASNEPRLKKFVRYFSWPYVIGFVTLIFLPQSSLAFYLIETVLRLTCYLAAIVIFLYGFIMRTPNFYLIMVATLGLILTEIFPAADLFNLWDATDPYPPARCLLIIIGYSFPFLAYSTYLSKDLALTSKKLVKEHIMNERLSREKYEQEMLTRKLLEVQNIELERNVLERTREISSQKEELEAQADKIIELDKIKSRFFANISHEFRTPLALILGPLEKKLAGQHAPEERRDIEVMHRSASRLLTLVNQLLDLSKLEDGSLKLHAAQQDISQSVSSIASQFASMAEARGIQFEVNATQSTMAFFDKDKLTKIVSNLLSNAFKFTSAPGNIKVVVKKGEPDEKYVEGYAEILVSDTGVGMAKEHLTKIFNRFYQVDNSMTREYEGSGIGLSLTKELVELHHGDIFVTSELGKGSAFVVRLPLGQSHLEPDEIFATGNIDVEENSLLQPPTTNGVDGHDHSEVGRALPRILLVDDNADMLYYLRDGLKEHFAIIEAADGEKGLEQAVTEIPDVIVSDLMMPKLDGKSLCQKLKLDERTSHIPLILLTAKADLASKIEGFQVGVDDYIPKPFHIEELNARIKNLIESRKKLQEKFTRQIAMRPKELRAESLEEKFIHKVVSIIETNISDPSFGVDFLAREAAMSNVQLYRKLKAITGTTPNDLIRNIRLERASSLLRQRAGNVADIAYQVGFNNLSYFSKCFREKFGLTPSESLG
jgi:signal transduction histidine kinase/AraC-like DNA-binding protein